MPATSVQDLINALFLGNANTFSITQAYGCTGLALEPYNPKHPQCSHYHEGIDFANGRTGTAVYSPIGGQGTVTHVGSPELAYGNSYVQVNYGNYDVIYGHLQNANVKVGDVVNQGDMIGWVGAKGNVTGPHLHFEVRPHNGVYGTSVDPVAWYTTGGNPSVSDQGLLHLPSLGNPLSVIGDPISKFVTSFEEGVASVLLTTGFTLLAMILITIGLIAIIMRPSQDAAKTAAPAVAASGAAEGGAVAA
jgi:hypothetical protein